MSDYRIIDTPKTHDQVVRVEKDGKVYEGRYDGGHNTINVQK